MCDKSINFGWKKFLVVLLVICLGLTAFTFAGCGPEDEETENPGEKTVASVDVSKNPTKTEYYVGEEFTAEGGELTVTYSDDTTGTVSMTDEGVTFTGNSITINDPNAESEEKRVTVTYGGSSDTFIITVSYLECTVVFDFGYDGAQDVTVVVNGGSTITAPTVPERDGFIFYGWYSDAEFTTPFDLNTAITGDMTLYARWLDESLTYYDVTLDSNYVWAPDNTPLLAAEGMTVPIPTPPTRKGYTFEGWYADADCKTPFDFTKPITADTTIYANWTIDEEYASGTHEYVFEAEDSKLDGKTYPGLSGTASNVGLIQSFTTNVKGEALNANNGRFVGYQTEAGASVDFHIISDRAIEDATIVLRLSKELSDYTFTTENYSVRVNNVPLDFDPLAFTGVPTQEGASDVSNIYALPFKDYVIAENVSLREGLNTITCVVMNSDPIAGTTITANGPLVDCLKITTGAVLDWSARNGLPANNY